MATEPNLAEALRDEMIRSELAKLKAKDEAELAAQAAAIVDAALAAKEAEEAEKAAAEANAKAAVEAAKLRAKRFKAFADVTAKWMVENECTNPSSIPASVVDQLRAQAGL